MKQRFPWIMAENIIDISGVIVFGSGYYGASSIFMLQYEGVKVISCFDNAREKAGKQFWKNVVCENPRLIDESIPIIVAISEKKVAEQIIKQCETMGYKIIYGIDTIRLNDSISELPDREFLEWQYFQRVDGKILDLENPKTFNEKIQWLKLYDHNPEYTTMVDKYAVKEYIASVIGEEYIIPTIGVWNNPEDIDFEQLPNQFVLKCTHDSGSVCVVKDKNTIDRQALSEKYEKALQMDYYCLSREWAYKDVNPRIIAEKYMTDENSQELKDYKIFNFNGKAKLIQVDYDRFMHHKRNLYTTDWEFIDMSIEYPNDFSREIKRPSKLEKMIELAEKLSKGIAHVRTDFYIIADRIYFGEMTFYHGAGYEKFLPKEWDKILGSWLKLPEMKRQ